MYKIGNSIDIHNLIKSSNSQKLGGISFALGYIIEAHSDGDIIFHAISEAILGALCLGDLGDFFSDKDVANKNMDSLNILTLAMNYLNKYGYKIQNLDLTIICENIVFNNKKVLIKENLIKILETDFINIKATRFEKQSNQIQCNCAILLKKII